MANTDRWAAFLATLIFVLPFVAVRAAPPAVVAPDMSLPAQLDPSLLRLLKLLPGAKQSAAGKNDEANDETAHDTPGSAAADNVQPPRLKAGDTILLRFDTTPPPDKLKKEALTKPPATEFKVIPPPPPPVLSREAQEKLEEEQRLRKALLPSEQLFVLDGSGVLTLTHIGRIALAGLNEEEAAERIAAEPSLQGLHVSVRLLPIEQELKPFGYDIFAGAPRSFAPAGNSPVPADYVVGPGDSVLIQLYGKESAEHEVTVTRDGILAFPGIGPVPVAGLKFSQMQKELQERARRQLIGTRATISLGRLHSIRIFILGEVERPGSYTVSGLSTLTNGLIACGGVKGTGSLRDVQVKRDGKVMARMDVYQLLLNGDNHADARLLPGDVIFVPPVGRTIGIAGRVRRPAIYELKDEKTLDEAIALAGGLLPDADTSSAQLERVLQNRARTVISADMSKTDPPDIVLRDGDVLRIFPVRERLEDSVKLTGHIQRPGNRPWRSGMRLTDVIVSLDSLQPDADARYLLIKRVNPTNGTTELIGANLLAALTDPQGNANIALAKQDVIHVFDMHEDRASLIKPMLVDARSGSAPGRPMRELTVEGAVHHPGRYPWFPGMRVQDLLYAAGGLTDRAYTLEAELTRFLLVQGEAREQAHSVIDIARALNSTDNDSALQPYDQLVVRRIPSWDDDGTIEVQGEVKFPGKYPIARGDNLSRIIRRAGGVLADAYPKGAVFLRESVRLREQEYLERLSVQLERDLTIFTADGAELGVKKEMALAQGQALLQQMRAAKATGRMVINLDAVLDAREGYDIEVQPGDKIIIPRRPDEVTVIGEVYYPTSHLYVSNYTRDDYVRLSGGITERGNKGAAYIVHANGSVSPPSGWFGRDPEVGPGDTVIVPLKVDRVSNLKLFTDISTVLFQLAVTTAALNAIGIF